MKQLNKNIFYLICLALLSFSCERNISVSPLEEVPPNGIIFIDSYPQKAKIFVDGINTGRTTPDSVRWLKLGEHKILLRLEGWSDTSFIVNLIGLNRNEIKVDFSKNPRMFGGIECITNPPGADILINDSLTGLITPADLYRLLPGEYEIRFKKKWYLDYTTTVNVTSGNKINISATLTDTISFVPYRAGISKIPTDYLLSLVIDKNNVKWIGTDGFGLVAYNDKDWIVYNTSNSGLPDNRIQCLFLDNEDILWIGTTNFGLVKFDGKNWVIYDKDNSDLPDNSITAIAKDNSGTIWIGTYSNGLAYYDGNIWDHYDMTNSKIPSEQIRAIAVDDKNVIWVNSLHTGVFSFDGVSWTRTDGGFSMLPSEGTSLFIDADKTIWAGYWDGLAKKEIKGGFSKVSDIFTQSITCIATDNKNQIYLGAYGAGLNLYSEAFPKKYVWNVSNSGLSNNTINAIAIDKNNVKWLATFGGGLVKFRGNL